LGDGGLEEAMVWARLLEGLVSQALESQVQND
jgi:hypothetical protein